ncbi:SDR family oxidoreductase [Polymorphum gilvum]|uniref:Uncharacterized oxidoreductase ytfG n=1 Tax=Polymorphum gilvum (strain LMG 25793 / CGMCC 1.9160 / SL003B-26A1) TaxID=991905 RepID=F2IV58_POLGS|nr:SDR family oxidoreductase [Polymorphum gilvum]ADZ71389.1 Uncharacterized oxidoreductase ytfG [Polymorphum gilvum SL003B-26A1]
MIAVTGANGQLGRLVLKHLAGRLPGMVRALVRTPARAADLASDAVEIAEADYDRPRTLVPALAGVERLLLVSGSEIGRRVPQHAAVITAAKTAGVRFIAYTSLLNAPTSTLALAREHVETEALLAGSGIAHALLRNGWYIENYDATIASALTHGAVVGASGDGRISTAGRDDYAVAAATVLAGDDLSTRALELAGDTAFSLADLAAELSRRTGRMIPFTNLAEADYAALLVSSGLPKPFAEILADSDRGAARGDLFSDSTTLSTLIGRPTKTLADHIAGTLSR